MVQRVPASILGAVLAAMLGVLVWGPVALAQSAGAGAAAVTPEEEEKARAHFRLGRAHYDNGSFAQAAVEMEEAYRISRKPALLYNIYLAYRDANDTLHAAQALRGYLELEKEVENRAQLEARLAALERSLADGTASRSAAQAEDEQARPAGDETTQPAPEEQTDAVPAPAAATQSSEERSHVLPFVLMGTGGAMILGSVVTGLMASSKLSELSDKCPNPASCDPSNESLKSSGQTLALVTDILLFGGIAVAGTGAVLFLLDQGSSSSDESSQTSASFACLPGACVGSVRGRF